jgi:hypothetical protein
MLLLCGIVLCLAGLFCAWRDCQIPQQGLASPAPLALHQGKCATGAGVAIQASAIRFWGLPQLRSRGLPNPRKIQVFRIPFGFGDPKEQIIVNRIP